MQGADVTNSRVVAATADHRSSRTTDSSEATVYGSGGGDPATVSAAITGERDRLATVENVQSNLAGSAGVSSLTSVTVRIAADGSFSTGGARDDDGVYLDASAAIADLRANYLGSIAVPPDAAYAELESNTFVALGASIVVPMRDSGSGNNAGGLSQMSVDYYVRPATGAADLSAAGRQFLTHLTVAGDTASADFALSLDATQSDMGGPDGGLIIWPLTNYGASPAWSVASTTVGMMLISRTLGSSGPPTATWTIRPPRHRFAYTDTLPTSLHPLRQFPRDDELGTGSASRIWPQPASQQGGVRRFGYY